MSSRPLKSWFGHKVKLTEDERVHRTVAFLTSELMVRAGVEGAAAGDRTGRVARNILREIRANIGSMLTASRGRTTG